MPEPLHPPYVDTARFQPRRLIRWLDVNAQNGPLTRTSTFITLPAFSIVNTWLGYSDIVGAYNFEAPNAFSLKGAVVVPNDANYSLAIMWEDENRNVNRYFIFLNDDSVFYFQPILYTDQLIENNFRLEVWSTNNTPIVNIESITFYTSVLTDIDYRYGNDEELKTNDGLVIDFNNIDTATPIPSYMQMVAQFKPSGMVANINNALVTWTDSIFGVVMPPYPTVGSVGCFTASGVYANVNNVIIPNSGGANIHVDYSTQIFPFKTTVVVCKFIEAMVGSIVYNDNGGNSFSYTSGTGILNCNGGTIAGIAENVWYIIMLSEGRMYVYDLLSSEFIGSSSAPLISTIPGIVQVAACDILEIFIGTNNILTRDRQALAAYFTASYSRVFSLPLIFPTNSIPQLN